MPTPSSTGRSTRRPTGPGRRRTTVVAATATTALAVVLGLTGCSGSSGSGGPTANPSAGATGTAPTGSASAPSSGATGSASASPGKSGSSSAGTGGQTSKSTPTAGSTSQTVPSRTQQTSKPVKIKKSSTFGGKVSARITSLSSRYVKAQLPGQVSGDAVVFTVEIDNGSSSALNLNTTVVTVTDSAGNPANQITSTPATRIADSVAAGRSARATYVFVVPKGKRDPITVDVTISADLDVVVFTGDAP